MKDQHLTLPNQETIHYQQWFPQKLGKAPSLLFIHGNFSNCEWWHDTINSLLHLQRHIIAVDLRGFGQSTYNSKCQRFHDWAQDLLEFCSLKGIKKCILDGWSFGGGVSMKLAEIAPELVTKIILTCSISYEGLRMVTGDKPCLTVEEIIQNPKAKYMIDLLKAEEFEKMKQVYEMLLFTHCKQYPPAKKEVFVRSCFKQRCYPELLLALANSDIDISKIKSQCLMIHGQQDLVIPADSVRSTGQHFKNFVVLQNNAHMIPIESPQKYVDLIVKFIEQS